MQQVNAAPLSKTYSFDFDDQKSAPVYSGTKATFRVDSIPSDIEAVHAVFLTDASSLGAEVLGPKKILVNRSAGSNYIEFNVMLNPLTPGDVYKSYKLKLKTFSKNGEVGYKVAEKQVKILTPVDCNFQEENIVCAMDKTQFFADGQIQTISQERSFRNECEMTKKGASFLYAGACQ